jgi:hypothetical protein
MTEEKKEGEKETIEIDKELYLSMIRGPDPEKEDRAAELGLIELWIYHCNRCNYTWLPKDFDYRGNNNILFDMELPKSCARCKSKYWNKTPQRETKNSGKMYSVARFRALRRTQY